MKPDSATSMDKAVSSFTLHGIPVAHVEKGVPDTGVRDRLRHAGADDLVAGVSGERGHDAAERTAGAGDEDSGQWRAPSEAPSTLMAVPLATSRQS